MENQNTSIFSFSVDNNAEHYLGGTAKWTKFLAVLGFIMLGLILAAGIFGEAFIAQVLERSGRMNTGTVAFPTGFLIGECLAIAAIYFYPTLALFRFSTGIKKALAMRNQEQFNEALRYLRNMFRYIGIVMIIILSLYALIFLFAIVVKISTGA